MQFIPQVMHPENNLSKKLEHRDHLSLDSVLCLIKWAALRVHRYFGKLFNFLNQNLDPKKQKYLKK